MYVHMSVCRGRMNRQACEHVRKERLPVTVNELNVTHRNEFKILGKKVFAAHIYTKQRPTTLRKHSEIEGFTIGLSTEIYCTAKASHGSRVQFFKPI